MLPRIGITLGWVVVVGLVAASARAQCRDGRVPTAEGECCWPAQTWNGARCAGPPSCPETRVAEGDACVLPMLALPPRPREIVPVAQVVDSEIPRPPPESEEPGGGRSIRHQLVGNGVALWVTGWTGVAGFAAMFMSFTPFGAACRNHHAGWAFVPVIGSIIAPAAIHACQPWDSTLDWIVYGLGTALQAVGLVLIVVGVLDARTVPREVELTADGVAIRF